MRFILLSFILLLSLNGLGQNNSNDLLFVENKGQWDNEIKYKAEIPSGNMWLTKNGFTFDFYSEEDARIIHKMFHDDRNDPELQDAIIKHHAYTVHFYHANTSIDYSGIEKSKTYHNYFLGSDPSKWAGNVPLSKVVQAHNLYDGVDLHLYSKDGNVKYDLIVKSGADPSQIVLNYDGIDLEILHKELLLKSSIGNIYEHAPIAYQIIKDKKKKVACEYKLEGNSLSFVFPKGYKKGYELIIDPELIFSTYSGSTADNWGYTATYDDDGYLYGGGIVFAQGYPTTIGAYDEVFNGGGRDIGITKYSQDGSDQVYSTYLGGSGADNPHSLMVDSEGNLVVLGSTDSDDYPTTADAFDTSFNGGISDIIVTKFTSSGNSLYASTYVGGDDNDGQLEITSQLKHNYGDEFRGEVFIDMTDDIFIASVTRSDDFPTTDNSEMQDHQGGMDACVFHFTPELDSLVFSTYLGGNNHDAAYSLKKKESLLVVAGGTASSDFPTTSNAINPDPFGGVDGFVLSLDSTGSIYNSTYLGTESYDQCYFVEIDPEFHVFVTGQTEGAYPVSDDVYSNENGSQFIHEMSSELSNSYLSTVFGTGGAGIDISLSAFLVDQCDHVYISGWAGTGGTGSTTGMPVTADAFQTTTDGQDFYFIVFDFNLSGLLYATFFGGSTTGEHCDGGTSRFDDDGIIYQAVCAGCGGSDAFPTTPGAWSETNGAGNCNLGSIKMEFDFQGVEAVAHVTDTTFCDEPPFVIQFFGSGESIPYHHWDFGDGGTSILPDPYHSYDSEGLYPIEYIVIDSSTCNISDTAYASVQIFQKEAFSMEWEVTPPNLCVDTLAVSMAFTGTGADSLIWDMDDGTVYYNDTIVNHTYYIPGVYEATLTAFDLDCEFVDMSSQTYVLTDEVVSGKLDVPNIFSPNNDGRNDVFRLFFKDKPGANPLIGMEDYHIEIYNRWGRKVFESGDNFLNWSWKGYIDGKPAEEGVYYYIMHYNSICEDTGTTRLTGYVTLVR